MKKSIKGIFSEVIEILEISAESIPQLKCRKLARTPLAMNGQTDRRTDGRTHGHS